MKTSKYPLESCGCRLPFWYFTLNQISDRAASDFNLLTSVRSPHNRRRYQIFLFGGDAAGLSVAIHYGASKSSSPTHILATYHRVLFVMTFCCDYVSEQNFKINLPLWQKFFSFEC
jgi:hypothetical protein